MSKTDLNHLYLVILSVKLCNCYTLLKKKRKTVLRFPLTLCFTILVCCCHFFVLSESDTRVQTRWPTSNYLDQNFWPLESTPSWSPISRIHTILYVWMWPLQSCRVNWWIFFYWDIYPVNWLNRKFLLVFLNIFYKKVANRCILSQYHLLKVVNLIIDTETSELSPIGSE